MRKNLSSYMSFAYIFLFGLLFLATNTIGGETTMHYRSNYEGFLYVLELVSNDVENELREHFLIDAVVSESDIERIVGRIDYVATIIKSLPSPEEIERRMSSLRTIIYVIVILMSLSLYFHLRFKWKQ